jgi:hypothetical protein
MPVAQVIRFDEREAMSRRRAPAAQMGVILQFPQPATRRRRAAPKRPATPAIVDEDRVAGRGRDPG